jgi:tetratricopeptide (TPR) repeat protein
MNLASALAGAGRKREALPYFEAAVRLGGDPVPIHHAWGGVLMDLNDLAGALDHFAAALRVAPRYAPAVRDFGWTLALMGRLPEAQEALEAAVKLDPKNEEYQRDLRDIIARRKK